MGLYQQIARLPKARPPDWAFCSLDLLPDLA